MGSTEGTSGDVQGLANEAVDAVQKLANEVVDLGEESVHVLFKALATVLDTASSALKAAESKIVG